MEVPAQSNVNPHFDPDDAIIQEFRDSLRATNNETDKFETCVAKRDELLEQHQGLEALIAGIEEVMVAECGQYKEAKSRWSNRRDADTDAKQWELFIGVANSGAGTRKESLAPLTKASGLWGSERVQHYKLASMGFKYCKVLGTAVSRNPKWDEASVKLNQLILRRITHEPPREIPKPIELIDLENLKAWSGEGDLEKVGRDACVLKYQPISGSDLPPGYTFDRYGLIVTGEQCATAATSSPISAAVSSSTTSSAPAPLGGETSNGKPSSPTLSSSGTAPTTRTSNRLSLLPTQSYKTSAPGTGGGKPRSGTGGGRACTRKPPTRNQEEVQDIDPEGNHICTCSGNVPPGLLSAIEGNLQPSTTEDFEVAMEYGAKPDALCIRHVRMYARWIMGMLSHKHSKHTMPMPAPKRTTLDSGDPLPTPVAKRRRLSLPTPVAKRRQLSLPELRPSLPELRPSLLELRRSVPESQPSVSDLQPSLAELRPAGQTFGKAPPHGDSGTVPMGARIQPHDNQGPIPDRAGDALFRQQALDQLKLKGTRKGGPKTWGEHNTKVMQALLSRATQPVTSGTDEEVEAYFLTGEEAGARLGAYSVLSGPIFTENQQQFHWDHGKGQPIEQLFRRMVGDSNRTVSVQKPSRSLRWTSCVTMPLGDVQAAFQANEPSADPLNVLELRNPLPRCTLPPFLAGEDCQLLSRVRDAVLQGGNAERCTTSVAEWNRWKDDEDWVLLAQGGALTLTHQDGCGKASWLTVQQGRLGFGWMSRPTEEELCIWRKNPDKFTGGKLRYVVLGPGQTAYFEAGTIHFVFRLADVPTLIVGGHLLRWSRVASWMEIVLNQLRFPDVTNEEISATVPVYAEAIAKLIQEQKNLGRAEELGGEDAISRFFDLKKEFDEELENSTE